MTPLYLAVALLLADAQTASPAPTISASPSAPPSNAPSPSPAPLFPLTTHGQLLILTPGYLVFTTGDAVPVDADARIAPGLRLGQTIRVRFDPASHHVRSVEASSGPLPSNEVEAGRLPRAYVAADAASARTSANSKTTRQSKIISVAFFVHVPDDTPVSDDVYISTDRSNFSPAELKMNRVDARSWSTTLPVAEGTTLRYQYTRGSYATVERDDGGGVLAPRGVEAHEGARTNDTVARWADTS